MIKSFIKIDVKDKDGDKKMTGRSADLESHSPVEGKYQAAVRQVRSGLSIASELYHEVVREVYDFTSRELNDAWDGAAVGVGLAFDPIGFSTRIDLEHNERPPTVAYNIIRLGVSKRNENANGSRLLGLMDDSLGGVLGIMTGASASLIVMTLTGSRLAYPAIMASSTIADAYLQRYGHNGSKENHDAESGVRTPKG